MMKSTHLLLIVTAVIELITGITMLIMPSLVSGLLLGAEVYPFGSVLGARVAGAALFSLGLICWLWRNRDRSSSRTALVAGILMYDVTIPAVLAYTAVAKQMHGIALWPACILHLALAIWCVACLRGDAGKSQQRTNI